MSNSEDKKDTKQEKKQELYVAVEGDVPGLLEKGNIDLASRPQVKLKDGSTATVRSMGINYNGKEYLIPTIGPKGEDWTKDEAVEQFIKTGKHLGVFDSPDNSTAYAIKLHEQQEKMYLSKDEQEEIADLLFANSKY